MKMKKLDEILSLTDNPARRSRLINDEPTIVDHLNSMYPFTNVLKEQIYLYENTKIDPFCSCGNKKSFRNSHVGYSIGCGRSCPDSKNKQAESMKKHWATIDNTEKEKIKQKREATTLERHGVDNVFKSKDVQKKIKTTIEQRYGVSHPMKSDDVKSKQQETLISNYGVDNPMKSSEIRAKVRGTNIDRYSVDNPLKSDMIREQIKRTNLEKYGYENPFDNKEVQERIKQTNIQKYGHQHPIKNDLIKSKAENTSLIHYGTPNPMMDATVKKKHKKAVQSYNREKFSDTTNLALSDKTILMELLEKYKSFSAVANYLGDVTYHTVIKHAEDLGINHTTWTSSGEIELRLFLDELGIDYISNDRTLISPKELDIYIPSMKLAIEYCGLYWHSDKFKSPKYHQNKMLQCESTGIRLITIFEDEWLRNPELIKSMLSVVLKSNNIKKANARDSIVVNKKTDLLRYHLQGTSSYSECYCLSINDVEVSAMTFTKTNPSRSELGWAIDRFVSLPNMIVRGGASKLFSAFISNHPEIDKITTFADARWSKGYVYKNIGFEYKGLSKPGYWYLENSFTKRSHRFNYTKKAILSRYGGPSSMSERELCDLHGLNRIYDCGHHRFTWTRC